MTGETTACGRRWSMPAASDEQRAALQALERQLDALGGALSLDAGVDGALAWAEARALTARALELLEPHDR